MPDYFGLGVLVEEAIRRSRLTRTGHSLAGAFSAPELHSDPKVIGSFLDVFSLGAVWFWMLCGRAPYGTGIDDEIEGVPLASASKSLLRRCLAHDRAKRPSLRELLEMLEPPERSLQRLSAMSLLCGTWRHTWTRPGQPESSERARINADGTYDMNGSRSYRVENPAFDIAGGVITFEKVGLPEHPMSPMREFRQLERLQVVSRDALTGHVVGQPDFALAYAREPEPSA
jgi:serine/threonine protein kinase